ncbi:MAG: OmpH family outer membrane protein [Bacteroidaceae bacterium]|nr:OmpH family outer membrane protein [Bacteroidaceae bacterium]
MKKTLFLTAAIAFALASCNQASQQEAAANGESKPNTGMRIAYVQLDTLMSQYKLYKDYSEVLARKGTNIQNTLEQKQRTLEQHANAMQKKYETNGFTTRDELERAQNNLQKEQMELQELAERLNGEFNAEQMRINEEARDSIQAFLKVYNQEKKYDYVMVKAGDNLLIANPDYDITAEIVDGLNKRYKGKPAESTGLKKMGEK